MAKMGGTPRAQAAHTLEQVRGAHGSAQAEAIARAVGARDLRWAAGEGIIDQDDPTLIDAVNVDRVARRRLVEARAQLAAAEAALAAIDGSDA